MVQRSLNNPKLLVIVVEKNICVWFVPNGRLEYSISRKNEQQISRTHCGTLTKGLKTIRKVRSCDVGICADSHSQIGPSTPAVTR